MKRGDYLLATFDSDTADPPTLHVAQVTLVDAVAENLLCHFVDSGLDLTIAYRTDSSGPWLATDDAGNSYGLVRHDIFAVEDAGPVAGDVALASFADGNAWLGVVEADDVGVVEPDDVGVVEPDDAGTVIAFYHPPYARMTIAIDRVVTSDWDRYPAGETLTALQRCRFDPSVPDPVVIGIFSAGRWSLAARRDAHPDRIGTAITPYATVVHTTDMTPETWDGLIHRWQTERGDRTGAHFAIGRSAAEGVVQLMPITLFASHAGGPGHGSFNHGGAVDHPNFVSVGIEVHCAGGVQQHGGAWRLFEDGAPTGRAIPDSDVVADPQRPGRGWHVVTDYQREQLGALLDGLEAALDPLPDGCVATALTAVPAYGRFPTGRVVGHVSLSPDRRSDPWPPTCDWLRARG